MHNGCRTIQDLSNEHLFFPKITSKSVFITTNGCSENRFDCAKMQRFFLANGWAVAENVKDADIILFNACGLTTLRENASLNVLSEMNAIKKKSAKIIVWGCFPKINFDRIRNEHKGIIFAQDEAAHLERYFEADINAQQINACALSELWDSQYKKFFNANNKPNLKSYLQKSFKKFVVGHIFHEAQDSVSFVDDDSYYIKISTGCLNSCSYCGVRFSRGKLSSESIQKIEEHFKRGVDKGYTKFTLIATDLGSYGRDHHTNLVELLNTLLKHCADCKLRLPNINPRWLLKMLPEFIDILSAGNVVALGSAVQTGSNRILKRMKRQHSIEDYKHAIHAMKSAFPDLKIRSNIIIGFPGETERDFRKTIQMFKEMDFSYADIHKYAPRPGTNASNMKDQVPAHVIESRYLRIMKTSALKYLKRKYGRCGEPYCSGNRSATALRRRQHPFKRLDAA
jgi:tRNA A37 methylthiotransferase MiaB